MARPSELTNVIAEKAVIGAVIRHPDSYWPLDGVLVPEHFHDDVHREIWRVISEGMRMDRRPTINYLRSKLPVETRDGADYGIILGVLTSDAADDGSGSAADYAEEIVLCAARRRMLELAKKLERDARNQDILPTDAAATAIAAAQDIATATEMKRPERIGAIMSRVAKSGSVMQTREFKGRFYSGLPDLDDILGPMSCGDLGVILASQGDGKTALALQMAVYMAQSAPGLFFELEMKNDQIGTRELSEAADVAQVELAEPDFVLADRIKAAVSAYRDLPLFVHDAPRLKFSQIRAQTIAMKRQHGVRFVIIDHARLVASDVRTLNKFDRLEWVTQSTKEMAKELDVLVLLLCQRIRSAQRRDEPTPQINDAEAPSIEQDADFVIAPYRKYSWLQQNKPKQKAGGEAWDEWNAEVQRARTSANIITLKRRMGEAFQERSFLWDGKRTRFRGIDDRLSL